jgi:hypothetical protein
VHSLAHNTASDRGWIEHPMRMRLWFTNWYLFLQNGRPGGRVRLRSSKNGRNLRPYVLNPLYFVEVGPGPSPPAKSSRGESWRVLGLKTSPLYVATYVCTLRKYRLFYAKSMFPPGKTACSPPKSAGYPDSAHASPSPGTRGSDPDSCPPGRVGTRDSFL